MDIIDLTCVDKKNYYRIEIETEEGIPMRVYFSYSEGYAATRWEPGEPDTLEDLSILLFDKGINKEINIDSFLSSNFKDEIYDTCMNHIYAYFYDMKVEVAERKFDIKNGN